MTVSNTLLGAIFAPLLPIVAVWVLIPRSEGWELVVLYAAALAYAAILVLGIPFVIALQLLRKGTPLTYAAAGLVMGLLAFGAVAALPWGAIKPLDPSMVVITVLAFAVAGILMSVMQWLFQRIR